MNLSAHKHVSHCTFHATSFLFQISPLLAHQSKLETWSWCFRVLASQSVRVSCSGPARLWRFNIRDLHEGGPWDEVKRLASEIKKLNSRHAMLVCRCVSITMLAIIVILIGYFLLQPCRCVNLWCIMCVNSRTLQFSPKYRKLQQLCLSLELQFFFFERHDISAGRHALFLHNMQWIKIVNGFQCAGWWFDGKL